MSQVSPAEKLRVLRARAGLTLTEVAEKSGIGRDTLGYIERGVRHPSVPTLSKLAKAYDIPVEDLLEEPELAPKASASPPPEPESKVSAEERREDLAKIREDYLPCQQGLDSYNDHWERKLASGELGPDAVREFFMTNRAFALFIAETVASEVVELSRVLDTYEEEVLYPESMLKPAFDRYFEIVDRVARSGEPPEGVVYNFEEASRRIRDRRAA